MKKRVCSVILLLALVLTALPIPALAAAPRVPIYLGYIEVDYMAEEILKDIPTAGKSPREQIQAVYDWIIANCSRYDWDGVSHFDEAQVAQLSQGEFAQRCAQLSKEGKILVRPELEEESGFRVEDGFIPFDANYYIATYAYEIMLTHTGNCAHFSSLLTVLLGHLGFDCRMFHGEFINMDGSAMEHTWNYILVDGTYYWADVRIDHAVGGHNYFLVEDTEAWAKEHTWPNHEYSDWLVQESSRLQQELDDAAALQVGPWDQCSPWAREYMIHAGNLELIPDSLRNQDLTRNISRGEFAAVAVRLYETLTLQPVDPFIGDSPFTDTADPDILRAYSLGVVNGMGEGLFAPEATLTREQAVAMLGRVYELFETHAISGGVGLAQSGTHFTDHSDIQEYARNYVYFFVGQSIVDGMGDGTFAPLATMTREQAIKIAVVTAQSFAG